VLLNPLNAKLNSICHLLALLGAHHIFHVSRIRVNLMEKKDEGLEREGAEVMVNVVIFPEEAQVIPGER